MFGLREAIACIVPATEPTYRLTPRFAFSLHRLSRTLGRNLYREVRGLGGERIALGALGVLYVMR